MTTVIIKTVKVSMTAISSRHCDRFSASAEASTVHSMTLSYSQQDIDSRGVASTRRDADDKRERACKARCRRWHLGLEEAPFACARRLDAGGVEAKRLSQAGHRRDRTSGEDVECLPLHLSAVR